MVLQMSRSPAIYRLKLYYENIYINLAINSIISMLIYNQTIITANNLLVDKNFPATIFCLFKNQIFHYTCCNMPKYVMSLRVHLSSLHLATLLLSMKYRNGGKSLVILCSTTVGKVIITLQQDEQTT